METKDPLEQQASALDSSIAQDSIASSTAISPAAAVPSSLNEKHLEIVRQGLGLIFVGASVRMPIIRDYFTPDAVREMAAAGINLADEYGIDLSNWLGEGGGKMQAWIRFGGSILVPTVGLLMAMNAPGPVADETTSGDLSNGAPAQ